MKAKRDITENEFEEDVEEGQSSGGASNKKKMIKRYVQIAAVVLGGGFMFYSIFFSGEAQQAPSPDQAALKALAEIPPTPGSEDLVLDGAQRAQVADKPVETKQFDVNPETKAQQVPSVQAPALPDLPDFQFEPVKDPLAPKKEIQEIPLPVIDAPDATPPLPTNLGNPDQIIEKKKEFKMFVVGEAGGGSGSSSSSPKKALTGDKDFIIYDKSKLVEAAGDRVDGKNTTVTQVTNLENMILQGKMLDVVLETAVNSQLKSPVRGIVARDVFGEAGTKILIPKGTRVYGTYDTNVVRGQSRLAMTWTRFIRPDGVSVAVSANASDQFGRAGIEADVDNRYSEIFGNSLLLSFVNLGTAVALDKITGGNNGQTQTVNSNGSVSTTNINPINLAAQSVISNTTDIANKLTEGASSIQPIVTLPQGTRIKVIVNQDITVPDYIKERF